MEIKDLIKKYQSYTQNLRREFHAYPELSKKEYETTKRIAKELDELGIAYEICKDTNTGIVAWIDGPDVTTEKLQKKVYKTVALRADIDGLPVQETNTFDFKSQNEGVMHACGHDGHMAILLGAARMLLEVKERIKGRVYLVFQPSEEDGHGAQDMMAYGDWYKKTDCLFGAHVWVDIPAGLVSVEAGPRMAAADSFIIKVHGTNGHGSRPEESIDGVLVASAIVMNLQSIVSRNYSALENVVVSVTRITAGQNWNIIPGEAELEGTTRYFRREYAKKLEDQIRRIAENTAAAYGATAELNYEYHVMPTINEEEPSEVAAEAVRKTLGESSLTTMRQLMAGEDFSAYQLNKPSCFAFLGIYNPEVAAVNAHHNNNFNMDDSILSRGSAVYAQFALDWLDKHSK